MRSILSSLRFAFTIALLGLTPALAQVGGIAGTVRDTSTAVLPGATVKLSPGDASATSNGQGQFTIPSVAPGPYTVTVDYVGFSPSTASVTVVAGQVAHVNVVMNVATEREDVIVTAERAHGEAEAINLERSTVNILDVLPLDVITSLPNNNIADAVNRLPGVTLERDEGEGKYVQIRGTEPRLSNLTVDGVEIPSPEGGVRQVKLDVIPADLVESVQIFKTLQANQAGDAIGGSVNLVTKTAGERPTASIYFGQGYTPIATGALVEEVAGAVGKRFGAAKRLGILVSGSYDYNGRKTYDLEPVPSVAGDGVTIPFRADYSGTDIRQYEFTRHRYGFGGSADYKISDNSSVYVHSLYSVFKDYGRRYAYTLATNPTIPGPNTSSFNTEARLPIFLVSSLSVGGLHTTNKWLFNWRLASSLSRQLNPINGGEAIATFNYAASTSNCQYDPAATKNAYEPQFSPACFTEVYNPANLLLSTISDTKHGRAEQLNLEGMGSVAKSYHLGSHLGIFEFGANLRNGHKFDDSYEYDYTATAALPATMFLTSETSPHYYDDAYKFGPFVSWDKTMAFLRANPGAFTVTNTLGGNPANFDLIERVSAGYVMNSLDFGRFHLVAGVRFEGTQYNTLSTNSSNINPCSGLCVKNPGTYLDVLPSASISMRLDQNSDLRFVFGKGLARPDPTALSTAVSLDTTTTPFTYTIGNPALKPEHAYDYDVLYERTLHPLGLVRAGFFYKSISDPFVQLLTSPTTGPYVGFNVLQPANGGSAYIAGIELEFQQHFTYLPGLLRGLGVSGNYSYTTSQARNVNPGNRTDSPALLRQAPNTWNLSPTYDRGRLSARVGLGYNGPNIFAYQFVDGAPLGIKGPVGDQYLYSHFQVDVQGSYYLGKGLTVIASGLNLNNAIFGLYNGSPQFVLQREIYHSTYLVGLRWDLQHEK